MRHVIKTQVINVTTDNSSEAFSLQHKLSSLFYRIILPELEKMFDELAPGEQVIYLDSVEIDLGMMTSEELEKKGWPQKFKEIAYRQLKEILQIQKIKNANAQLIPGISHQWLYYMQYGFLPWNTINTDQAWYEKVLEELAKDYNSINLFRKLISNDRRAVSRIVLLHASSYLAHLVEVLTAQKQADLALRIDLIHEILSKSEKLSTDGAMLKRLKQQAWERIFMFVVLNNKQASEEEIIQKAILKNLGSAELKRLQHREQIPPQLKLFISFIKDQLRKYENTKPDKLEPEPINNLPAKQDKAKIPEEGIFVKYAGLVILHPFLNQFFKTLHLTTNGKFKDRDHHQKAITLLHYIATGNMLFEEHELVVSKTLCGYLLHDIAESGIIISQTEKEEADGLLQAVIAEWSILKNTTANGLRESFLQRNGKLITTKNDEIRVIVESHALDVLLDHLPWALSIIKFPWMPQVLKVDWK